MTRTIFAISTMMWLAVMAGCGQSPPPRAAPVTPTAATATSAGAEGQPQRLATATIKLAGKPLVVEVARTEAERRKGMMFRSSLGPDETMLFIFERPATLAFWMKNTLVDLDVAYIAADGRVTQVETMKALDESPVPSVEPVRFVLEAPKGWMAAHKVAAGTHVEIPPEVDRPADR